MNMQTEQFREAFQALSAPPGRNCPNSAQLLAAASCELPVRKRRLLVAHMATCPSCATDWRLAMTALPEAPQSHARWTAPRLRIAWLGALAFACALVVAVTFPVAEEVPGLPSYRQGSVAAVASALHPNQALPADRFMLRWTQGPEHARYNIRVTTTALTLLAKGQNLATPEFRVPAAALASLLPGDTILWQVETIMVSGRKRASQTFRNRLATPPSGHETETSRQPDDTSKRKQ